MSFEYGLSSALNAVGFMQTVRVSCDKIGLNIPGWIFSFEIYNNVISVNPMSTLLVVGLVWVMLRGIKESIMVNNIFTIGVLCFY